MRGWVLISVLALAGCGEHLGVNPNYQFGGSPYGTYLAEREAALVSNGDAPRLSRWCVRSRHPHPNGSQADRRCRFPPRWA